MRWAVYRKTRRWRRRSAAEPCGRVDRAGLSRAGLSWNHQPESGRSRALVGVGVVEGVEGYGDGVVGGRAVLEPGAEEMQRVEDGRVESLVAVLAAADGAQAKIYF